MESKGITSTIFIRVIPSRVLVCECVHCSMWTHKVSVQGRLICFNNHGGESFSRLFTLYFASLSHIQWYTHFLTALYQTQPKKELLKNHHGVAAVENGMAVPENINHRITT